jgi:hypothetical protein
MLVGTCQTARAGARRDVQLCEFDLRFGASQLTTRGIVEDGPGGPGTFHLAITGGTGRYLDTSGQIAVTATNASTIPITVELSG